MHHLVMDDVMDHRMMDDPTMDDPMTHDGVMNDHMMVIRRRLDGQGLGRMDRGGHRCRRG
jgi:hypothetical protein